MVVNADLQKERQKASFSGEKITNMLDGGVKRTERRRHLEAVIERDPTGIFDNSNNDFLHRTERHVRAMAKSVRLVELCRKLGIGNETQGDLLQSEDFVTMMNAIADDGLPVTLHLLMFVPNIVSLCDEEQQARWLPLCRDWRMIGCYAQTELGHGSNIRALETTATFLPESKGGQKGGSFVINSPTLTSRKFWPGTLGRTANYAMVIAQLIDGDGVNRGIHNFLVPLRSMKDHSLLPGVKAGDIGPKIGYNNMDNGMASFDNVIIPRRNMAMRFSQVDENGKYSRKKVSPAASKIAYVTMMQVRVSLVHLSFEALAKATTINVRYSAVRKQGFAEDGTEVQIIDYKQQQHRIFPLIAAAYAFFFSARNLKEDLDKKEARLVENKKISKAEMEDIHASSSALKAFATTVCTEGVEECRKACGGHGYLSCSGLPELYTATLQTATVEGDNHMLPQHVIKVLLKLVQAVQNGDDLEDYKACLSYSLVPSLKTLLTGGHEVCPAVSAEGLCDTTTLVQALNYRAARCLVKVAKKLNDHIMDGKSMEQAWNLCLVGMAKASKAYSVLLFAQGFAGGIESETRNQLLGPGEVKVMTDLFKLFVLYWIEKDLGDFLEDGYLSAKQSGWISDNVIKCLDTIRPNAVSLVDAFDLSDFRLKSALGRFDGDVYPHIIEAANKDPLNAVEPGPGYPELKKLITGGVGVYSGTASRL